MKFEMENRQTRILLFLCGLLALIIVAEWLTPVRADSVDGPAADSVDIDLPVLSASNYVHPSIDNFDVILERPVFLRDRKLPPALVAERAAPPSPIHLALQGVAIVAEARVAVLRDVADQQLLQLAEGMSHNGWNLETLNAESAIFRRGEQLAELRLDLPAGQKTRR